PPPPTHFHACGRRFTHNSSGQSKNPLTAITVSTAISETSSQNIPLKGRTDFRKTSRILAQRLFAFELRRVGRPDEPARRICHLAIEGERYTVRVHDRALVDPGNDLARIKLSKDSRADFRHRSWLSTRVWITDASRRSASTCRQHCSNGRHA